MYRAAIVRAAALVSCVGLYACASQSVQPPVSQVSGAADTARAAVLLAASNMTLTEVDAAEFQEQQSACERQSVVGTRIIRNRCYFVTEAELDLQQAQTQFEIEWAREQAMIAEQERLDEWARQRDNDFFRR